MIVSVLGITDNVDQQAFARSLAEHLQPYGKSVCVSSSVMDEYLGLAGASQAAASDDERSRRVTVLLDKIESDNDFVLLVSDADRSEWTKRCIRHCDELLGSRC